MRRVARKRRSRSRWGPCFAESSIAELYRDVRLLSGAYPGWSLGEIKGLSIRERAWWVRMEQWAAERRRSVR